MALKETDVKHLKELGVVSTRFTGLKCYLNFDAIGVECKDRAMIVYERNEMNDAQFIRVKSGKD